MKAFEEAAAKAAKLEEERARRIAEKRRERVERRAANEEAAAARRRSGTQGSSASRVSIQKRSSVAKAFVKRTEVDRRMDELRAPDGGLKDKDSAVSLLRLFSLAMQGEAGRKGTHTGASQKDLSILLAAIEQTKRSSTLQALVDANASTVRTRENTGAAVKSFRQSPPRLSLSEASPSCVPLRRFR